MDFLDRGDTWAGVRLTTDELRLLNNALNEVCNGVNFCDSEFATRLGVERNIARGLLDQIGTLLDTMAEKQTR